MVGQITDRSLIKIIKLRDPFTLWDGFFDKLYFFDIVILIEVKN